MQLFKLPGIMSILRSQVRSLPLGCSIFPVNKNAPEVILLIFRGLPGREILYLFLFPLIEKKQIAAKTIKRYDKPKTPYQRIIESKHVSKAVKRPLREQFENLNPFQLRKAIDAKLKKIFAIAIIKNI